MDLIPVLSGVVLVSTLATLILAVLSYAAFKIRDKRKPRKHALEDQVVFFRRYHPEAEDDVRGESPGECT